MQKERRQRPTVRGNLARQTCLAVAQRKDNLLISNTGIFPISIKDSYIIIRFHESFSYNLPTYVLRWAGVNIEQCCQKVCFI